MTIEQIGAETTALWALAARVPRRADKEDAGIGLRRQGNRKFSRAKLGVGYGWRLCENTASDRLQVKSWG